MSKAKLIFCVSWCCLLLPNAGKASNYDQYSLVNGDSVNGWAVAADGERVLFRLQDGTYCYHAFSEVADATKSKIEDLRKRKDIVHTAQYVESSDAPPDRYLIPTYDIVRYDQEWGSIANAAINFMLWWDKIGVCQIPDGGTEAEKAEWLLDTLYRYGKAYEGAGSSASNLVHCLEEYFNEHPSQNYTFEYEVLSFGDHPDAFVENARGLNLSVLTVSRVASGRLKGVHAVSLIQATRNNGVMLNAWGKSYMGQLFKPSGLFNGSADTKDMVWDVDILPTCPDDFDKGGDRWIIHASDRLLVMRPVRRPDAPPKLLIPDEPVVVVDLAEESVQMEEVPGNGEPVFWMDEVVESRVGYAELMYGSCLDGHEVYLGGKKIHDYIFAHAPSKLVYAIPEGAKKFNAWGVRPGGSYQIEGSWRYIILIDGKRAYQSKALSAYNNRTLRISVAIPPGAKRMELWIDPMGENFFDHSIWALPEFE